MAGSDILERIDAHLARGHEEFRLNREFQAKALEDWKEFTRTMVLRVERLGREELRALSRMNDGLERMNDELRGFGAEQRDLRAESRAQTEALLRMIDRLDGPNSPPPA